MRITFALAVAGVFAAGAALHAQEAFPPPAVPMELAATRARGEITVDGRLGRGVGAKDVILAIIATIGAGGGVGHAL